MLQKQYYHKVSGSSISSSSSAGLKSPTVSLRYKGGIWRTLFPYAQVDLIPHPFWALNVAHFAWLTSPSNPEGHLKEIKSFPNITLTSFFTVTYYGLDRANVENPE